MRLFRYSCGGQLFRAAYLSLSVVVSVSFARYIYIYACVYMKYCLFCGCWCRRHRGCCCCCFFSLPLLPLFWISITDNVFAEHDFHYNNSTCEYELCVCRTRDRIFLFWNDLFLFFRRCAHCDYSLARIFSYDILHNFNCLRLISAFFPPQSCITFDGLCVWHRFHILYQ